MKDTGRELVEAELRATGLPWSMEVGKRHVQVRLGGKLVGVMPTRAKECRRAALNVRSQVRQAAKEMTE